MTDIEFRRKINLLESDRIRVDNLIEIEKKKKEKIDKRIKSLSQRKRVLQIQIQKIKDRRNKK